MDGSEPTDIVPRGEDDVSLTDPEMETVPAPEAPAEAVLDDVGGDERKSDDEISAGENEIQLMPITPHKAYHRRDGEASRHSHIHRAPLRGPELHKTSGEYLKSFVFGGLDGIITVFGVVAGITGGDLSWRVLIIIGIANLISDALSMGVGDLYSTWSETQYAAAERKRETWECENYLQGEIDEMVELYQKKGLSKEDSERVVELLSKDIGIFVDFMMVEELGILPETEDASPVKNAIVTFFAFLILGAIPLASYLITTAIISNVPAWRPFVVAIVFTVCTLFLLGSIKSRFTSQKWYISGLQTMLLGALAAGTAYAISLGVKQIAPAASI